MAGDSSLDADSSIRALMTGGGVVLLGLVVELGISFLGKLVVARVLGPVDYGYVFIGITILTAVSTLTLVGLDTGIGRYLPRYDDAGHRRGVLTSAFQVAVPLTVGSAVVLVALAPWVAGTVFNNPAATPFIRIFALMVPFAALMKLAIGSVQGMQASVPKVYIQNLSLPITRFGGIVFVLVLGFGAIGVAWAYAFSYVIAALLSAYYLWTKTPLFERVSPIGMRRELLAFSAPLTVTKTMRLVLSRIDVFMLGYFTATEIIGIYGVIYPIAQLLTSALAAFGFVFMPLLSEAHAEGATDDMYRFYQISTKWMFMVTLPVFLVVAFFPTITIRYTFGPEYVSGAFALTILATGFFMHVVAGPNAYTLTTLGRTRLIMYDNLLAAAANVALNLLLIPRYGLVGAAVATAVAYILLNVLYASQLYRETGIQPLSPALVRPGVAAVAVFGLVFVLKRLFLPTTLPVLFLLFSTFVVLYGVVVLRFGGIEEEEVMLVNSFEERFDIDLSPIKDAAHRLMA